MTTFFLPNPSFFRPLPLCPKVLSNACGFGWNREFIVSVYWDVFTIPIGSYSKLVKGRVHVEQRSTSVADLFENCLGNKSYSQTPGCKPKINQILKNGKTNKDRETAYFWRKSRSKAWQNLKNQKSQRPFHHNLNGWECLSLIQNSYIPRPCDKFLYSRVAFPQPPLSQLNVELVSFWNCNGEER